MMTNRDIARVLVCCEDDFAEPFMNVLKDHLPYMLSFTTKEWSYGEYADSLPMDMDVNDLVVFQQGTHFDLGEMLRLMEQGLRVVEFDREGEFTLYEITAHMDKRTFKKQSFRIVRAGMRKPLPAA